MTDEIQRVESSPIKVHMKYLKSALTLPNGTIIDNRIAKSAMNENLANWKNRPTDKIVTAYKRWSTSGAGLMITGNIMVDSKAIGEARNIIVEDKSDFHVLQKWAATFKDSGTHLWTQINHPGRQALSAVNKDVVAPSAIASKASGFVEPRALREDEILELIERYGNTAQILKEAGFTGVEIHGAHGYLISQFLSPLSNIRTDQWGGSIENRSRFVVEIYRNIRKKVGNDFPVAIKINSADFQRGGFTEEESLEVVKIISSEGIDLIEISGGTFETPAMVGAKQKESTIKREAYFLDYIEKARKITSTPLMLTGGFRTVSVMEEALSSGKLDIVGMARPFANFPDLANEILSGKRAAIEFDIPESSVPAINNFEGMDLIWHELQIQRLSSGKEPDPKLSRLSAILYAMRLISLSASRRFSF